MIVVQMCFNELKKQQMYLLHNLTRMCRYWIWLHSMEYISIFLKQLADKIYQFGITIQSWIDTTPCCVSLFWFLFGSRCHSPAQYVIYAVWWEPGSTRIKEGSVKFYIQIHDRLHWHRISNFFCIRTKYRKNNTLQVCLDLTSCVPGKSSIHINLCYWISYWIH